jgi:hypothetical protein
MALIDAVTTLEWIRFVQLNQLLPCGDGLRGECPRAPAFIGEGSIFERWLGNGRGFYVLGNRATFFSSPPS